jgi:integrative and conjugative element protein (TIGR02256 family)
MTAVKVELSSSVRRLLRPALRRAGRREIGGVLMGEQIAPSHFRVVDLTIDTITGGDAHFVRDQAHHDAALEAFFASTGNNYARFNYLGEWHSHPSFPVRPSFTDIASMRALVEGERDIEFAVLLIVRLDAYVCLRHTLSFFARGAAHQLIQAS